MKTCWAQYLLWLVIALLGTGAALSGCGQRGPLYLPKANKENTATNKPEKSSVENKTTSEANTKSESDDESDNEMN